MSNAAKSLLVFAIYLVGAGLGFLLVPNIPLALLGVPTTTEVWIRLVGMLLIGLGYYYIRAAFAELTPLFSWSVHARLFAVVCMVAFVVFRLANPTLLLFAAIDFLATLWTALALRSART